MLTKETEIWFFICNSRSTFFFKIVRECKLPGDMRTVQAIASVLAAAQKYMRDQLVSWKKCLHEVNLSGNDLDIVEPRLIELSIIHHCYENVYLLAFFANLIHTGNFQ